ncbi:MAG: hypothetical protein EAX86_08120 [Candidatus Heimdallarchaeota archaeon]|nr:hypothetical protein [Candidatus Heimdallarchaeota archaeon]
MDPKEIEQLRADLDLLTKTAHVLASKLEKVSQKVDEILATTVGAEAAPSAVKTPPTQPSAPVAPTQAATVKTSAPTPKITTSSADFAGDSSSKAGRLLDAFLGQAQTMTKGKDIAAALSRLRDQVMQTPGMAFHPAFHEMGRYATQMKSINQISAEEKEALFEKIYDWKARLTTT